MHLWWTLQTSVIILSGRTCTIGDWKNTLCSPWAESTRVKIKTDTPAKGAKANWTNKVINYTAVDKICSKTNKWWKILTNPVWCCVQVSGLEEGQSYVFKVRAVNESGLGKASQASEPVCAKALPGQTLPFNLSHRSQKKKEERQWKEVQDLKRRVALLVLQLYLLIYCK